MEPAGRSGSPLHPHDQFNPLGPEGGRGGAGDYEALVGRRRGFVAVYVKHHPAASGKVSDLIAAR
jgi:hypothetical protein